MSAALQILVGISEDERVSIEVISDGQILSGILLDPDTAVKHALSVLRYAALLRRANGIGETAADLAKSLQ